MKKVLSAVACAAVIGWAGSAMAVPVQWSGNGHYYEVLTSYEYTNWRGQVKTADFNSTWTSALSLSDNGTYQNMTSYFATVTSQAENNFIAALVAAKGQTAWLGGVQGFFGVEPAGGWYWASTMEAFTYTNWAVGEPNDAGFLGEDFLEMYTSGKWNDAGGFENNRAFVVEYSSAPVPEPTTMLLFGTGLAGLAAVGRRRTA